MFSARDGAYRYLSGYLKGEGGLVRLDVTEIPPKAKLPQTAFARDTFPVAAVGVEHKSVPAFGFLVTVGGRRIALSADQTTITRPSPR